MHDPVVDFESCAPAKSPSTNNQSWQTLNLSPMNPLTVEHNDDWMYETSLWSASSHSSDHFVTLDAKAWVALNKPYLVTLAAKRSFISTLLATGCNRPGGSLSCSIGFAILKSMNGVDTRFNDDLSTFAKLHLHRIQGSYSCHSTRCSHSCSYIGLSSLGYFQWIWFFVVRLSSFWLWIRFYGFHHSSSYLPMQIHSESVSTSSSSPPWQVNTVRPFHQPPWSYSPSFSSFTQSSVVGSSCPSTKVVRMWSKAPVGAASLQSLGTILRVSVDRHDT